MARTFNLAAQALLLLGSSVVPFAAAHAVVVGGLYNTGVDDSGAPLGNDAADPHYSLVPLVNAQIKDGVVLALRAVTFANTPLSTLWIGDDAVSRFLSPSPDDPVSGSPAGVYFYQTTFDLGGYNPASARIYGQWATDDFAYGIAINGSYGHTFYDTSSAGPGPNHFALFHVFSGFVSGINTLTFTVGNDLSNIGPDFGPETGLRVEFSPLTAEMPEPVTLALLATGLLGLGMARARKRG